MVKEKEWNSLTNRDIKSFTIKGAVLDKSKLCSYLEKLAAEQVCKPFSDEEKYPIKDVRNNFQIIRKTNNLLNEHIKLKISIDPAGEWLLDNFYLIEEATKSIEKELSKKMYKHLWGLARGEYKGFARVYVLASEMINYTDGKLDEESISLFLKSYQNKKMLTMDEIWSLPIFLKISILQNIRELCEKIYISQMQKYKAESMIERFVDKTENQIFNKKVKYERNKEESISYSFIEYLSYKLKSYGKKGTAYLEILEEQVNKMGLTVSDVIKQVHFSYAVSKVTMGNLITTLKEISHIDFGLVAKQLGGVEELLKLDPAGVYSRMDYLSQNEYQNKIQEIARKTNISELYIAKTLIKLASEEQNNKTFKDGLMHQKRMHVGYYLIENENELYKKLEIKEKKLTKEQKSKLYVCLQFEMPAILCFIAYVLLYAYSKDTFMSVASAILLYYPFTEITMQVLTYILGKVIKQKRIPKMDYLSGVPKEAATFVAIPTILSNPKKVQELARKLEVFYLANKSENLYFAILGDVTSEQSEEKTVDKEIVEAGINAIKKLNDKYKEKEGEAKRFHFLYRKRKWNAKESTYLGWERKRGLLIQFNNFLLDSQKNDFRYNSMENEKKPNVKYVITLDADTELILNSGLELIGAMDHVLNLPIVENGKVAYGHGLIQPRIGVNLTANSASTFSKIFSEPGGTDLYTNAISDTYQDNFDEGIYTGKGIYNLKVFSQILTGQIPENLVLSHDLLEGSYLRAGLATDILLLDGFPAKFNSYMTRQYRWIRGDWQILQWLGKKIKGEKGDKIQNPLNTLSKFKIYDNLRRSILPIILIISILVSLMLPKKYALSIFIISLFALALPTILSLIDRIVFRKEVEKDSINANRNFTWKVVGLLRKLFSDNTRIFFFTIQGICVCKGYF